MRIALCVMAAACGAAFAAGPARDVVVALGAEGEPPYGEAFRTAEGQWAAAAKDAGLAFHAVEPTAHSRDALQKELAALPRGGGDLWLVLIGHGTFDGRNAKFNLRGEDLAAPDLAKWLEPFRRRVIVLALFSAGGAFLPELSAANRVVVTATRDGAERNYSRFGEKLALALADPGADLDADGRVSLVELAARAAADTKKFYDGAQRIVPEHALLDDNGDRLGTEIPALADPASRDGSAARGIGFSPAPAALVFTPAQERRRAELETRLAAVRARRSEMPEDRYLAELEPLLLDLAALYESAR